MRLGLATFKRDIETWLAPSASPTRWDDMLHALESTEGQPANDRSDIAQAVTLLASRLKRRGLVVLVSDLLNDAEKTLAALKLLKFQRHDVLVMHVLDRTEVDFKFDRATRFVGLEGYPALQPIHDS